ncbi:cytoplasmic protein [Bacillus sp. AFS018417]|uniref:ribonuclease E inhibitor RraB n=1 Tax=Bacillus sp. AFS018417 TaxID=2033491 RepID=UPI000BF644D9|nr:ribonuclease E inhibitor RraB [Bacillus sp. AFS018417]PEY99125.1 cytoplasmic protein [Bacillus sp. AFS018417]
MKFPKDEDGKVLKMLYKRGVDFSKLHVIDFFVAVPNQKNGEELLLQLNTVGFHCELLYDEEFDEWTCTCSREMMLKYGDIIATQKKLSEISKKFDGYVDGWGTFSE